MKTPFALLLLLLPALLGLGCIQEKVSIPDQVAGLAPIYFEGDWKAIQSEPPRPIGRLFKLYYKDKYLFAGESQQGIHIIDNSDPANPQKVSFIRIVGNSDIAIRGNVLYANNLTDLVALDISEIDNVRVLSRVENAFPDLAGASVPNDYVGFFECPDPNMGVVIGWSEEIIREPQCWR
ncbi:MAG: hypothetical protein KDD02_07730 [Phaeodactylibacter sp.]|nr:hypothetical protein [Phaeodactylibacter sp.]MCB9299533.1 hypothetical protein [Lewinellaceae bacterium]